MSSSIGYAEKFSLWGTAMCCCVRPFRAYRKQIQRLRVKGSAHCSAQGLWFPLWKDVTVIWERCDIGPRVFIGGPEKPAKRQENHGKAACIRAVTNATAGTKRPPKSIRKSIWYLMAQRILNASECRARIRGSYHDAMIYELMRLPGFARSTLFPFWDSHATHTVDSWETHGSHK